MRRLFDPVCAALLVAGTMLLVPDLVAQTHVRPPNGGKGVPGPFVHSFVIEWEAVEGAAGYEYVLSDNPSCFSGCPGDTREARVGGTSATEFNLRESTWYYWITRVHFADGTASGWSPINSFLAETPEISSRLAEVAPNPAAGSFRIHVDWGISPSAQFLTLELFDAAGRSVLGARRWDKTMPRLEVFDVPIAGLAAGVYFVVIVVDGNPNNLNNRVVRPLVIL